MNDFSEFGGSTRNRQSIWQRKFATFEFGAVQKGVDFVDLENAGKSVFFCKIVLDRAENEPSEVP